MKKTNENLSVRASPIEGLISLRRLESFSDFPHRAGCGKKTGIAQISPVSFGPTTYQCLDCGAQYTMPISYEAYGE